MVRIRDPQALTGWHVSPRHCPWVRAFFYDHHERMHSLSDPTSPGPLFGVLLQRHVICLSREGAHPGTLLHAATHYQAQIALSFVD